MSDDDWLGEIHRPPAPYYLTFVRDGVTDQEREEKYARALQDAYAKGFKDGRRRDE